MVHPAYMFCCLSTALNPAQTGLLHASAGCSLLHMHLHQYFIVRIIIEHAYHVWYAS